MKKNIVLLFISLIIFSLYFNTNALEKKGWVTENGKTYYYDEFSNLKQWWQKDKNGVFYLQEDGSIKQGLQSINGIMYYIDNNYISYGEIVIDDEVYVFKDKTGEMEYGSIRLSNNTLIYVEKNGKHYKDGWIESKGNKYYQKDKILLEGFQKIGSKTYYFEPNTGKLKQWWQKDKNGVFYLQADGSIKQGLQSINGIMYYIDNNYISYGEVVIDDEVYVFKDKTGEMEYGSIRLSNNTLIYVEKNGKHYKDGWIESKGNKYYQKDKKILEGFQKIGTKTYYFEPNTGKLKQWWQKDENGVFYLQEDGSIKQGLQSINGIMYYIENNYIYYGEKEIDGELYKLNETNGELVTGIYRDSKNKIKYLTKDGKLPNGWIESNGNKYYQKDKGLLEGFQKIGTKTYYFEPNTGKLKQWWQKDENGVFYLQADGSIKQGLQSINGIIYYIENNYIYYGEKEIDGELYKLNETNGELVTGIYRDSKNKIRYSTRDGKHPRGWIYQGDYVYYIKDDGTACVGNERADNRDYFFGDDGVLWGFYWDKNKLYYKNPDGTLAKGIEYIGGRYIKFDTKTGAFEKYVKQIRVIDVSSHQGIIDWERVKASGQVNAVILRLGYGIGYYDSYFIRNKNELERLGIPYSVYLFSYAENAYEALLESNFVINVIRQNNVHIASNMLSIYYDLEDWEIKSTGENSYGISHETYRQMINTFVDNIEKNLCIKARVYASKNYIENRFPEEVRKYTTWVAQWNDTITYKGPYEGWQYTNNGSVPGISTRVDMNIFYY